MITPLRERPEMDLVLPGSWASIDLSSPEASKRCAHDLAVRLAGRRDDLAVLRAQLRSQVEELAAQARDRGAADLYLAQELVPGLSVPLSLSVCWLDQPILGSLPSTPATVIALVREALMSHSVDADDPDDPDDLVEDLGVTTTLRRCTITHSDEDHDAGIPAYDNLLVEYWVAVPGTQFVVLLTFSTPFLQGAAQLLEMFRAMVNLIRWHDADGALVERSEASAAQV